MRRRGGGAGFTLLELCVCLGIIGIALSLALQSFSSFLGANYLNVYSRQIVSDLRETKQAALSSGNYAAAKFYPKTSASPAYYAMVSVSPSGDETSLDNVELPANLTFSQEQEIRFAPSSFCQPGYSGTITLQARRQNSQIVVSSCGRIR
ncbi:MAG: prepilin-type N-terminal cleavage/methylation domain-containing protein [Candidatus Margulisiibacteriota bacterium]